MELVTIVDGILGETRFNSPALGRQVASAEWLVAYLACGAADEVIILSSDAKQEQCVHEELDRYQVSSLRARLTFRPATELPDLLRTLPEPVFFMPDPQIHVAKRALRLLAPDRIIPAIGLTHTLSTCAVMLGLEAAVWEGLDPCDAIICTSRAAHAAVKTVLEDTSERHWLLASPVYLPIVPLGIFPDRLASLNGESSLQLPLNRPMVTILGRFTIANKMDLVPLIEHWPDVLQRAGCNPILVLAGAGDDEGTLQVYRATIAKYGLEQSVWIITNLSDKDRAELLGRSRVFCAPSDNLQETFGLAVVEALAAGLPVVASDWDGYRDLFDDGVEGFLIPTRWGEASRVAGALSGLVSEGYRALLTAQQISIDLDVLVDRLVLLLVDHELCARMGAQALSRAKRFAWPNVVPSYDAVFRRALIRARERTAVPVRPLPPEPSRVFAAFPTTMLCPATRLVITRSGASVLGGDDTPIRYVTSSWNEALQHLRFTSTVAGLSVEEMLVPFGDDWLLRERGLSVLLWMLKRGWLQIVVEG